MNSTVPCQPAILDAVPAQGRFMEFQRFDGADPWPCLAALAADWDPADVIGLGPDLVPGLPAFAELRGPEVTVPASQRSLWCWLRGDDRGVLLHRSRRIMDHLRPAFRCELRVDGFKYGIDRELGMDLTGYEDGTENPSGADAVAAGISAGDQPGAPAGGSFVAVQQWVHDLHYFETLPQSEQDHVFGRGLADNEELDDAPESAHVKRTAQESFEPEAFMLRRSMPWADGGGEGLMFIAFGRDLAAYQAVLARMAGLEDGITDALFRFSRPITGGFYWCPPIRDGRPDLAKTPG